MNEQAALEPQQPSVKRTLVKNTLYVTLTQVLTMPLSILSGWVMARYLSAEDFGQIYLASTVTGLSFLFVNFGHEGALPAAVARDPKSAGTLLGSSMLSRSGFVFIAYAAAYAVGLISHYAPAVQQAVAIMFLGSVFLSVLSACKETIRGFERIELSSAAHLSHQVLVVIATVVALLLGAQMPGTLLAQALATAAVVPVVWWGLRVVGVRRLSFDWSVSKELLRAGVPFVAIGVVGSLQPFIDGVFLARGSSADVVGAYSVARRLLGVLMFAASGLVGALYPTLCRLWVEDRAAFARASSGAIRGVNLLAVPLAIGCWLYPEVGVAIFGRAKFAGAESDLRVLAPFVLLVYISMPLGTCILAAGKQRVWSVVQSLCVVTSLLLDPVLVSWFETRNKNGALGVCVATVVSEAIVVGCGFALVPKGILDLRFFRSISLSLIGGAVMAVVTYFAKPILPSLVAAALASVAYFVVMWLTGGLEPQYVDAARAFLGRRLARFRSS
jgi:O-antigen/teichoic acid export membrane protein